MRDHAYDEIPYRAPEMPHSGITSAHVRGTERVLGLPANIALALLALAAFMCCVPMAMPQGHLVAFCSDLGIAPAHGAAMLSLLLGCAFLSRQFWGLVTDRIGGLRTVLAGSVALVRNHPLPESRVRQPTTSTGVLPGSG